MSHFAKVLDGVVIEVLVADPTFFTNGKFVDTSPGRWVQTSYNTRGNVHYRPDSTIPSGNVAVRGNYAGIGYHYDIVNDVFYAPQPYPSWTLNTKTWLWDAPIPYPTDGKFYKWNESTLSWILV